MGRERAMHGKMHVILAKLQVSMQNVGSKLLLPFSATFATD